MHQTNGAALTILKHDDTEAALRKLAEPGQVFEIRILDATTRDDRRPHNQTGYFDDPAKAAAALRGVASWKGCYWTPNPVNPSLLARAANRLRKAERGDSTSDADIARRRWLLVDVDPTRPANISSSDQEHEMATERGRAIFAYLRSCGWPEPFVCDSGNGWQAMYRIDEPADDAGLVERCLKSLAFMFDRPEAHVDTTVHNPARIWRLPGTLNRKGDNIEARPHRFARLLVCPEVLGVVSTEQLHTLADQLPEATKPVAATRYTGQGEPFDVAAFIQRHGLDVDGPHEWRAGGGVGRKWIFNTSPLCGHHDASSFVGEMPSGAIVARCHHNSCSWEWSDLREQLEPQAERLPARTEFRPDHNPAAKPEPAKATARPITLDVQPWRPFPTDALPERMRGIVERGAECIGVDETFLVAPALGVASIAIGNTRRIAVNESWHESATVWAAACGEPGTRKTPAQKLITKPLEEQQDKFDDEHNAEDENALRLAVFVTDCTIERLAGVLHDNPRGVGMVRDELSSWFQGLTRYRSQGSDAPQWLELFNDGRLHIHRKTGQQRYISVRNANVPIIGSIQPEVLRRCLQGGNTENGLASRFLLSAAPKRLAQGFPRGVDEQTRTKWTVCIRRLFQMDMDADEFGKPVSRILAMSDDATAEWEAFYGRHQVRLYEASGGYAAALSKLERYALRLALVFHLVAQTNEFVADENAEVTGEAMRQAVRVVEWYVDETRRIYGRWAQGDDQAETFRVVDWLEARGGRGTVGKMIAGKLFHSAAEAELAMAPLVTAGIITPETITHDGPGKPRTEYVLKTR